MFEHDKCDTVFVFQYDKNSEVSVWGNEGLSSTSSSLDWSDEFSDDYESSTRIQIYEELLLMNKVLKGEVNIPPHYDSDEYEQWMHRFPYLSILDSKTPVSSPRLLSRHEYGSSNMQFTRKYCDTITSQNNDCERRKLAMLNNSDINIENDKNFKRKTKCLHRKITAVFNDNTLLDSAKYLRICGMRNNITRMKQSAKFMPTKYVPNLNPSLGCDSLPIIKIDHISTRKLPVDFVNKQAWNILPRSLDHEDPDHLVLPPITINNFRSISAIPRQYYKTSSALSTKSNLVVKRNDRKWTNNCL